MKRNFVLIVFVISCLRVYCQTDSSAIIEKNAEIFRSYLENLNASYVDKINTTILIHKGIDAINRSLDPYTVFSDEKEVQERLKGWKGYMFSGIGVNIIERDSMVTIVDLYENCPAHISGVRVGDQVLEVDSCNVIGMSFGDVIKKIKGEDSTKVNLTLKRPGVGKVNITVTRQKIISKSINFYGMINDSVGYIRLSQFLESSYDTMRYALNYLKKNVGFSYLILDMRDNIGGLVQDAVNTVNLFIPKGKIVCDLKSENNTAGNYNYPALFEPVDTNVKIIALSSNVTVSAGEVVLGALQDYDRAVIIGQRTYGKGYVQGTRNLAHNTQLYLTAARYYTPSGRCIQELDYTHKYIDGKVNKLNDSIKKEFYTKNNRKVMSAGGIEPDVKLKTPTQLSEVVKLVVNNYVFGDFATYYRNTHSDYPDMASFKLTDNEFNDFMNIVGEKLLSINTAIELDVINIESMIKKVDSIKPFHRIKKIKNKLKREKKSELKRNKDILKDLIEKEILIRYYNNKAKYFYVFTHDSDIKAAFKIFQNDYDSILNKKD